MLKTETNVFIVIYWFTQGNVEVKEFNHEAEMNDWFAEQIEKELKHFPQKKDFRFEVYYGKKVHCVLAKKIGGKNENFKTKCREIACRSKGTTSHRMDGRRKQKTV